MYTLALLTTCFKFHPSRTGLYQLLIVSICPWKSAKNSPSQFIFDELRTPKEYAQNSLQN
jgi:hypothetical protein